MVLSLARRRRAISPGQHTKRRCVFSDPGTFHEDPGDCQRRDSDRLGGVAELPVIRGNPAVIHSLFNANLGLLVTDY